MDKGIRKVAQGEIFGVALLFVVLIIGILIYGEIGSLRGGEQNAVETDRKYNELSQSTLDTLLRVSTGCEVERDDDSLKALINYCVTFSRGKDDDPKIECGDAEAFACSRVTETINSTLEQLFTNSSFSQSGVVGPIPYEFKLELPSYKTHLIGNVSLSNFGNVDTAFGVIEKEDVTRLGFGRTNALPVVWATDDGTIEMYLLLYYH